jgi:hypothetical protein
LQCESGDGTSELDSVLIFTPQRTAVFAPMAFHPPAQLAAKFAVKTS